jgi:hypothetical protein
MRDILETEKIGKPESIEIMSELEKNAKQKYSIPTYRPDQEELFHHTVQEDSGFLNDMYGNVQVEIYEGREIKAVGDRFIIETYFPKSSYK